jgi:hypothetical protein
MLANTDGTPVYWLHFAQIYAELPGRPVMLLARAHTCAIIRAELDGPHVVRTHYKEAGLYLEPTEDRQLSEFRNPATGRVAPVQSAFREGPAVFAYTATDEGIFGNTELDQKTTRRMPWTWHSSGSRIWMINEDAGTWASGDPRSEKIQSREPLSGRIMQTWHADGRDFDPGQLNAVPCFKSYMVATSAWPSWAGDPGELGTSFVRGMGAKLTAQGATAYPEFTRLKRMHPDFFAAADGM